MIDSATTPPLRGRTLAAYAAMIAATVLVFLTIRWQGQGLMAPAPTHAELFGTRAAGPVSDTLMHVLLALVLIIVMARLVGTLFKFLHQPPVIGEVIAGLILGPSLLGRVLPHAATFVLPQAVAPFLSIIAQVGVILYMFLVGLELDTRALRQGSHATIAISHASIITPFVLGAGLALWIYPRLSSSDVPFTVFALFMGVSMSVTAFPVLARILTDRGMQKTPLGVVALSCAAVDDVTAWCLLAFVVSVAQARAGNAIFTVLASGLYIAAAIILVRPVLARLSARVDASGKLTQGVIAIMIVGLLLSALATELIGIHAIFGAFLLGAIIPHDSLISRELTHRLEDLVVVLFLPAFFAFTGLRTQIGLVSGTQQWLFCGLIIVVACLGKFGGTLAAARLTGISWRQGSALGVLMNTRGLMELIVLNIGLDLRVLNPTIFAMLVIMAVVTTLMTTPILHALSRGAEL